VLALHGQRGYNGLRGIMALRALQQLNCGCVGRLTAEGELEVVFQIVVPRKNLCVARQACQLLCKSVKEQIHVSTVDHVARTGVKERVAGEQCRLLSMRKQTDVAKRMAGRVQAFQLYRFADANDITCLHTAINARYFSTSFVVGNKFCFRCSNDRVVPSDVVVVFVGVEHLGNLPALDPGAVKHLLRIQRVDRKRFACFRAGNQVAIVAKGIGSPDTFNEHASQCSTRGVRMEPFVDRHLNMIDFYYWTTPNGHKVTLFLEESGLPYRFIPINISRGEQFAPDFLRIAPNNRIPAIVDHAPADGGEPLSLFESGAILLYLADKTSTFIPGDLRGRNVALQWLFWQMGGLGPMAGQNHHFVQYAPEKIPYAMDRYIKETSRLYGVLNKQLSDGRDYIAGEYSIADMACYPWVVPHERQKQDIATFPYLHAWLDRVAQRPATERAYALAKTINETPTINPDSRKLLFGQDAQR